MINIYNYVYDMNRFARMNNAFCLERHKEKTLINAYLQDECI